MIMLTGIEAFEARWQSIKGRRSANDGRLLMQAMNQLVNNYATQEELTEELPASLQHTFAYLVDAYLNGFWSSKDGQSQANPAAMLSPAMLAAQQIRQRRRLQPEPTTASEAATYIIRGASRYS